MRIPFLTLLLLATAALSPAQEPGLTILPAPSYNDAKQYLGLSDAQTQSLDAILRNRNQAQQSLWQQISEKNRSLYQLLEAGTGSAGQIGQLMIDIKNLEKQMPTLDAPYRTQALNVLTADQKTRLAKLDEALKLQNTASQAAMLLLLEYPRYIGLPMPVDAGGGIGNTGISSRSNVFAPVIRRQ
jgi:Spy/CpxP family protein refolding chaperone